MLDIILNQTKLLEHLGGIYIVGLLVFSRSLAFVSIAPLIGNKALPALVRISFAMMLTLLLMPNLEVPTKYPQGLHFIYLIVMNVFVGLLIGWLSGLLIEIGRTAGEMLDGQMALNAATLFDPGSQTQTTIVGRLFDFVALTLFISIGGMEKVIEGLYKSYATFPIIVYQINLNFDRVLKATADVIAISFLIISPIVIIILTIDLILGLMSRAAPQINAFQISFSIKPSVSVLLLIILLPALFQVLANLFSNPMRFF